jgi:hypothetical protein
MGENASVSAMGDRSKEVENCEARLPRFYLESSLHEDQLTVSKGSRSKGSTVIEKPCLSKPHSSACQEQSKQRTL